MLHSINENGRLYNIRSKGGFTCLGFDVCERQTIRVMKWLGLKNKNVPLKGTSEAYDFYIYIMELGAYHAKITNNKCDAELIPELIGLEGKHVEVTDSDGNTRDFWVGKSSGWMPCHIELKSKKSPDGIPVYGKPFKSIKALG